VLILQQQSEDDMSQQSAIKVKNLVKSFGKDENLVKVIENASFEIQKGEVVALIAPSGAGKTTLLMMIGCVLEPTSGEIWLGEEMVYQDKWIAKDTRRIRREKIGFIFQAHYLIPFLNVIENVTLLPQANKVSEADAKKKAMELLEYLEIADKAYNMSSQLSGGQNQRVAIARALANNPEIILADEPTAALDGERSVSVIKMLKKIAREQNVAIITVTHDERILPYCDRIMKIQNRGIVFHNIDEDEVV
jgi:putative ABC transport system ATP-binding protein